MKELMNAVVATAYGAPDVLKFQSVVKPQVKENEILIKNHASTATTADTMMRTGKPYIGRLMVGLTKPKHPIPGTGFAGIVETVGENVKVFKKGDRVFGETTLGFSANAEYLTVAEDGVVLIMPEGLDFVEAATFSDGHLTSINFLKEIAKIKSGQKVLINGAAGSLGTAAVQLAKYYGAEVTAVCSTRNVGLVKSLGADYVIDYTKKDFTKVKNTYDLVYDTVGKSTFKNCKNILKDNGLFLSPVLKFSLLLQMMWTSLFGKKKAKFAATGMSKDQELRILLMELVEIYKEGKLKSVIDRQFSLEQLPQAHNYIASGHKKGNVAILI